MPKNLPDGVIDIRGKQYHTVAKRVDDFRKAYPEHSLTTEIITREAFVTMKASIADPSGRVIATGHAEEDRSKGQINKTSALENCETSAIGRALAAFGIGGTEFASANEMENALHQQSAGSGTGTTPEDGKVSPTAPISDADWSKIVSLCQATNTKGEEVKAHIDAANLKVLSAEQLEAAFSYLDDKLAKMAKAETDEKAKEPA